MPNIPQQETIVQYITSSSQTAYTFAFYAPENTDIEVYYQAANATPIPASDILALGSDYTVTYNSDPITGGTITLLFTPTSGYYLTINRNVLASLNTNFAAAQTLSGQTLDTAFDRLLLLCQQNQNYALERNLSYIINTYLPNAVPYTQLPTLAQNYIWIGSGAGVVSALVSQVPSASLLQSMLANASPGTAGAKLVGYYDLLTSSPTTVSAYLDSLGPVAFNAYYPTGGSSTAITITVPNYTSYTVGDRFYCLVSTTNTGYPTTFNVNGIGANQITCTTNQIAFPGDLAAGTFAIMEWNGSDWVVLNPNSMLQRQALCASVSRTLDQSFPVSPTITQIQFNAVNFDRSSMWNAGSYHFVVPYAGFYRISAAIVVSNNHNSAAGAELDAYVNGSLDTVLGGTIYATTGGDTPHCYMSGTTVLQLNASDYIDLRVTQGGSVATAIIGSSEASFFEIEYLGQ